MSNGEARRFHVANENGVLQDGDQTKYVPPPPPTTFQAMRQSAEYAWKDVVSEGENLMKQSVPIAKDIGVVAKEAAVVAKDFVGKTVSKLVSPSYDSGAAVVRDGDASAVCTIAPPIRPASISTRTWTPPPNAFTHPLQRNQPLSDSESTAIANAVIDEELTTGDVETEEVKAFLTEYRRAKLAAMEDIPLGEPVVEDADELEELMPRGTFKGPIYRFRGCWVD